MLFSVYPTDSEDNINDVVKMANNYSEKIIFTSLHIPESKGLLNFLNLLKSINKKTSITFFADISPHTLKMLDKTIDQIAELKTFGIIGVRIDFGFTVEEIKIIASQGFEIAINASVVDEDFISKLSGINLIAWHNFYPRPETALSQQFFESQNKMFEKHALPIYTFIPGEVSFRSPLFMGLPTLENQRMQNAYSNFLNLSVHYPNMKIVVAEGTIFQKHMDWIKKFETEKIITVPLSMIEEKVLNVLTKQIFTVRKEETDFSWRLENTRSINAVPSEVINAQKRFCGSLQMDTEGFGRYSGEIHIMKNDTPLNSNTIRIGEIPNCYLDLTKLLGNNAKIQFVKA